MAEPAVVVDWVFVDKAAVQIGDLVSADAGGMPTYRVIALENGRAWLREGQQDRIWVLPLDAVRWKAATSI